MRNRIFYSALIVLPLLFLVNISKGQIPYPIITLSAGWQLQDAAKVQQAGTAISTTNFKAVNWYKATVPGTVLTTLVNNKVYPEPLYGENNRPDRIPESINKSSYWYRTVFKVPAAYHGKNISINFDGINYAAQVWVNGKKAGDIKGAFSRGIFDITKLITPGKQATVAVLISPQPHPGFPQEHTITNGMGHNGGITAMDGPTFLCTIGWDWIPAIRDRNTGIWQKVFLAATDGVEIKDPLVTSDVALPGLKTAEITIQTSVKNNLPTACEGVLTGYFGAVKVEKKVKLAPNSLQQLWFKPADFPQLHLTNPKLWWPNGYGAPNLYDVKLVFETGGKISDVKKFKFGIRKITYSVADTDNLTLSVNGIRVFCKGGNWGMDEAMKRIPRQRLEAQIKMHKMANYTIIRNWVGQSTSEDFYELCDQYGLMLWDEFFQPNPSDGPNPTDLNTYLTNVREKILRYRNHASIAIWCARNEGYPPKNIDSALRILMAELEPVRLYQPSSTDGRGVNSGGPYYWRTPAEYYTFKEAFKTEIGSMSVPTLESIQGMMPKKDWESVNDDWAEHDFADGAQRGLDFRKTIDQRYGKVLNLADFVRKSQLANYEAFRAMYEGRNAKLFSPCSGVITWMSNPAQPSFVWQLYHHDLEPNASLFAVRKGCEPVHIQLNEKEGNIQVINNMGHQLPNASAQVTVYNSDGKIAYQSKYKVNAAASKATNLGMLKYPATLTEVYFVKLELKDAEGVIISENFYWKALPENADNLEALNNLPRAKLAIKATSVAKGNDNIITVTIHNPSSNIALMTHLQLRNQKTGERVLPVYYSDNYISLAPKGTQTITITSSRADLKNGAPVIFADGWNIDLLPGNNSQVKTVLNLAAQPDSWPVTGLPIVNQ
jgi:hypothetical protein